MPEFDLYLLVHPERWPSNDCSAILGGYRSDPDLFDELFAACGDGGFDAAYGWQVVMAAADAGRAVVLLDPSDTEALIEDAAAANLYEGSDADVLTLTGLQTLATKNGGDALCVTEGAPLAAFSTVLEGDAYQVEELVATLTPPYAGATVLVGGFARHDCVRRAEETLQAGGWSVSLCARTVLPLNSQGFGAYLSDAIAAPLSE
jgi:hypothetical protein